MSKKLTTKKWAAIASIVHNNLYDYSRTNYISAHQHVQIICITHGMFQQRANDHRYGRGCPTCANEQRGIKTGNSKRKSTEERLLDFIKVHGMLYTYSNFIYTHIDAPVIPTCSTHGEFETTAKLHMMGSGCPSCSKVSMRISKPEKEWLDLLDVPVRQHIVRIGQTKHIFDGYNPVSNTAFLFNGDFWHGNPKLFNAEDKHPMINKTYGELYT
jgi:Zn finger protein HypA/HybF involved in hydrogenase expression